MHVPAPVFGMVQLYQCTIYHCTRVPVHHVPPQALAPILCNALMRSSLHGWRVHGHNVVTYHCHGGLDNCQPESTFMFHWVYSRPWLLLCFLQFGLLLVLCNASLCNGSNQCPALQLISSPKIATSRGSVVHIIAILGTWSVLASILVDKRFKLKKKPKNEVVHHFQIQDVWKNVSDISLGTETNLYSFDGFQQKLALRKIRCGLPTGNHRARQFSRKYAILKRAYLYLYIHTYICNCIFYSTNWQPQGQAIFPTKSREYASKAKHFWLQAPLSQRPQNHKTKSVFTW